ncbi:MAG TPA: hypothetical protein VER96_22795 [Polyangiaceae bacterium]|nr:hypothetical protein [Polyangiaceae bacterium]
MTLRLASAAVGLATLFSAAPSFAQGGVQLRWQAPLNCPQEAQVRQKLRDLLGTSASDASASRLRAEGSIEPVGERFRLTLNIHYDLVNGTRVVQAASCEDLGGVAAVTLAILFRAEHSSGAPLTAHDLGGASTSALADARTAGTENQTGDANSHAEGSETRAENAQKGAQNSAQNGAQKKTTTDELEPKDSPHASDASDSNATRWHFVLSAPELRTDIGALPNAGYGLGFGAGARHDAWRFLISGTFWLAQEYQPGPFVGYGAHFGRMSGELSGCHGFQVAGFELSPCLLFTVDDVAARGTGTGISSSNPRTAWLSVGAGLQGLWSLGRQAALVFGVNGRVATSRPRFVSEGVGEISQVGPAAVGVVLGCEWLL